MVHTMDMYVCMYVCMSLYECIRTYIPVIKYTANGQLYTIKLENLVSVLLNRGDIYKFIHWQINALWTYTWTWIFWWLLILFFMIDFYIIFRYENVYVCTAYAFINVPIGSDYMYSSFSKLYRNRFVRRYYYVITRYHKGSSPFNIIDKHQEQFDPI